MLSNRSMPSATVIPELGYPDVNEAATWLCTAFGFVVRLRIADHRIQLTAGDGAEGDGAEGERQVAACATVSSTTAPCWLRVTRRTARAAPGSCRPCTARRPL